MGEVWKALDTSLQREVAIKALPEALAGDADRLARFDREAKLLAALNHPNIASIHGLEESGGVKFLVLELVQGGTLAGRLARGAVPIDDALKLALQIAEALEAAHEKGILHRDLKPGNISVTPSAKVKVLDFGLAKALEASTDPGETATAMTEVGVAVGTPAYMSPEQARGESVGRQTDIWSFGVVLYELLTGISAFSRNTTAETLAHVLTSQPDYGRLPPGTPAAIERLIRRCLDKDPKRRLQHVGDARIELEDAIAARSSGSVASAAPVPTGRSQSKVWMSLGAVALVALAAFGGWFAARRGPTATTAGPVRVSLTFPEPPWSPPSGSKRLAIAPDGSTVAVVSSSRVWIRRMDQKDAVSIPIGGAFPFFSPDGQWIGVMGGLANGVAKVPTAGGTPVVLARTGERPAGAAWHADGTIVFATTEGLFRVSENGGEVRALVAPNRERGEILYAWPSVLPGGRSLLFTLVRDPAAGGPQIASLDLATLAVRVILPSGSSAQYLPSGHLVYASGSTLRAIRFDAATESTEGEPFPIPDVEIGYAPTNGAADFALSASGTLVFLTPATGPLSTLRWIDRNGKEETLDVEPRTYVYPRVSPDGSRVALDINQGGGVRDIWILDLARLTQTRLTDGPTEDLLPVWSRDGRRVFFSSNRSGNFEVYSQAADGASQPRVEFAGPGTQMTESMTLDGSGIFVTNDFKEIGLVSLVAPPRMDLVLGATFNHRMAQISPDGKWLAYESNESGSNQFEIMVRSFPDTDRRREKVSVSGGRFPFWSPRGANELYYVTLDGAMMAAAVSFTPDLKIGRVSKLFDWQKPPSGISGRLYDVSPIDGRFIMNKPTASDVDRAAHVSVILNWVEDLKKRWP